MRGVDCIGCAVDVRTENEDDDPEQNYRCTDRLCELGYTSRRTHREQLDQRCIILTGQRT